MHLISVIVPVYKVEEYLRECVDSIISQTYSNLEIILIDDGSPDNCPAICDEYAEKDERIIVIHQQNGGLSTARNAGLDIASGEFICFVDSDDIIHPQYCEVLYNGLLSHNAVFSACQVKHFHSLEDIPVFMNSKNSDFKFQKICFDEFIYKQITRIIEMGVWNRLYKKELFKKLRFKNGKLHEDIIFAGDLFEIGDLSAAFVESELYFYRQRENSIITSQTQSGICSIDRIFAGDYLFSKALKSDYKYIDQCFNYAFSYPFLFVDKIYVYRTFNNNRVFLKQLKLTLKKHRFSLKNNKSIKPIIKKRMLLLSKSRFLYAFNAYTRLMRVYLYKVLKKDPYTDGHGI